MRIFCEVVTFEGLIVREPTTAIGAEIPQRDHPNVNRARRRGRRERYRLSLAHEISGIIEPLAKLLHWIRRGVASIKRNPTFAHETSERSQFGTADRSKGLGPFARSR